MIDKEHFLEIHYPIVRFAYFTASCGVLREFLNGKSLFVKLDDVAELRGIKPNLTIKTR